MEGRDQESSLTLVTLATLVMGLDYASSLFFPDWGAVVNLNRVLFLGIIVYDFLTHQSKYRTDYTIYVACFFILLTCIPFLGFVEVDVTGPRGGFSEFVGLIGTFAYILFFYVNCRNTKAASRICIILFFCSLTIVVYLLGIVLGITGEATVAWRGNVQFTRASGDFDPNAVMLYMISCFAFGPLLAFYSRAFSGFWKGMMVIAVICVGGYVVLQLNSRSGTIVLGVTLSISLIFRSLLTRGQKLSSRIYAGSLAVLLFSIPMLLQLKYGIFDTIVAIYRETHLGTDTSFAGRLHAYQYLSEDILFGGQLPNPWGNPTGYSEFWHIVGGMYEPHCSFVDIYIKGGLIYLFIYIYLFASSILGCLRRALWGDDIQKKAICAGLFAYLIGVGPLMITLSIENCKMWWGIIGCALGMTAHIRRNIATGRQRGFAAKEEENAQWPG